MEPPELPSSHYGPWPCVPSRAALSVHARADLCLSTTLRAPSASGCGIEDCATRLRLYAALTLYRLWRAHVAPSRAPITRPCAVALGALPQMAAVHGLARAPTCRSRDVRMPAVGVPPPRTVQPACAPALAIPSLPKPILTHLPAHRRSPALSKRLAVWIRLPDSLSG